MYNHPWCVVLLALTQLHHEASNDPLAAEALEIENISPEEVENLLRALEEICDVSFRP